MKQTNLLPEKTFLEKYRFLFGIMVALAVLAGVTSYGWRLFCYSDSYQPASDILPLPSGVTVRFAKYSIYKLKIVGYLCREAKPSTQSCWGVVKTPDGLVSKLKTGDCIGSEKAQVVDIQPAGIYLNIPQKKDFVFIPATRS